MWGRPPLRPRLRTSLTGLRAKPGDCSPLSVIMSCPRMLNVLQIPPAELFSLLAAIGFAAGLNLYATVAVLGLLARFGHLPLPPGLLLLAGWPVLIAATALSIIEFFADK